MADPTDVDLVENAWWDAPPCGHNVPTDYPESCGACCARSVLSALAGRLTPAGGETGTEYNLRFRNGSGRWITDDDLTSYKPEDDWSHARRLFGADVHQVTRTVTTWPDGTALIGPWQPFEEGTDG